MGREIVWPMWYIPCSTQFIFVLLSYIFFFFLGIICNFCYFTYAPIPYFYMLLLSFDPNSYFTHSQYLLLLLFFFKNILFTVLSCFIYLDWFKIYDKKSLLCYFFNTIIIEREIEPSNVRYV